MFSKNNWRKAEENERRRKKGREQLLKSARWTRQLLVLYKIEGGMNWRKGLNVFFYRTWVWRAICILELSRGKQCSYFDARVRSTRGTPFFYTLHHHSTHPGCAPILCVEQLDSPFTPSSSSSFPPPSPQLHFSSGKQQQQKFFRLATKTTTAKANTLSHSTAATS